MAKNIRLWVAGKPEEEFGVRDFIAKFGGYLLNFGCNIYMHKPTWLGISKFGYKIYQGIKGLKVNNHNNNKSENSPKCKAEVKKFLCRDIGENTL